MRLVEFISRVEEMKNVHRVFSEYLKGVDNFGDTRRSSWNGPMDPIHKLSYMDP
jgi:hypothetical protein